jgi:threonine/homoserine/homoserine lactone efflux protein
MIESAQYLVTGIVLGTSAGIMPGPLTTLVITETMRHNRRQGIVVACVPLITDLPIIMLAVFLLAGLEQFGAVIGIVSIAGAIFLAYLAFKSLTASNVGVAGGKVDPQSLKTGLITNFLSPNPYVFWMTVGAATILNGYRVGIMAVVLFLFSFYICLVGTKISLAIVVDKFKSFMSSSAYLYVLRITGIVLLIFSAIYMKDGLEFLGVKWNG